MRTTIEEFIQKESSGGIVLMIATAVAMIVSNSPLASLYQSILHLPMEIRIGPLHLDKTLYLWVNDGLMAIFFLLVGLEVKREIVEGHLSSIGQAALPVIAAIGGMLMPALIYLAFNMDDPVARNGWAVPTATDIAFALGILSLLGKRAPASLKIFLMALAIIDDLGAIVIIAVFYTANLSLASLAVAGVALLVLILMNYFGVVRRAAYFLVGIVLWVSVLKSGVHATLAGVALAFTIPLTGRNEEGEVFSPLKTLEHDLHHWVAFFILPVFAFVNAGVNLEGISPELMMASVPLGIFLGLFVGKQLGVFVLSAIAIKLGFARIPEGSSWWQLYGVSVLTGIGFTMSLFILTLAFEDDTLYQFTDKLAILLASLLSGLVGYTLLRILPSRGGNTE